MHTTVYFSKIKDIIIEQLQSAKELIKVSVAWLTDEDIIRNLTHATEKGIVVQVVISNSKENFRNISKFKEFIRLGGLLYVATPKFMHNKFCIIDNKAIINGSYNWTYFAQSNDENILLIKLDNTLPEDKSLLNAFNVKYDFFCNRSSQQINNIEDLNVFRELGNNASLVLSQIDEEQIKLRQALEDDVKKSFEEALKIGIPLNSYLLEKMKLDGGGVEFIKRILHDEMSSNEMKSGFKKLEEPLPHRVDLSLEYLVSRPVYQQLFSPEQVDFCVKLMNKYNIL